MAIRHTQGIVKFAAGKVFHTTYGERINAVVDLQNGEEIKLWGSPGDSALLSLKKGQAVRLADAGKGSKLMLPAEDEESTAPQSVLTVPQRWTQEDINQFMGW